MSIQRIAVTAGAEEYVTGLVEAADSEDLTLDAVQVAVGDYYAASGQWAAPDSVTRPTTSSIQVSMLITNAVIPGDYYLWVKTQDNPQVVILRATHFIAV